MIRLLGTLGSPAAGATLLCIAGLVQSAPSFAEGRFSWGGSLSLTSDYVYRGLSQTEGRAAVQGALHVRSAAGWSAGLLGSTVNRAAGPGARSEVDLQLSKAWTLSQEWDLLLSANHYFYPDDNRAQPYEYDELIASLSYQSRLTATVSWSPNTSRFSRNEFVRDRTARSYELTVLQPLAAAWSLYGGVGHYDLKDLFDNGYWYWSAGITYSVGNVQMDLTHIDTDHTARRLFDYEVSKRQWAAALSWRF